MPRLISIVGLQAYAVLLAVWQWHIGVRTDEAKYLLDIPYPHPPLARFVLSLLDGWQYQEIFWRVVFATLVIQSVWLILDLVRGVKPAVRISVALCWLLSAAVILQAGTVMMAPLTALQGLVFIWLLLRDREPIGQQYLVALFWLVSLFTAYQAALFFPFIWAVLRRAHIPLKQRFLLIGFPLFLLSLYTLSNPLAAASLVGYAGSGTSLMNRLIGLLTIGAAGGSVVLSLGGIIGLLKKPTAMTLSFIFLCVYVFLSPADYYAILFTPFFIAGLILWMKQSTLPLQVVGWLMPLGVLVSFLWISMPPTSVARTVYASSGEHNGAVLLVGSFGHEWQYETTRPVLRYHANHVPSAGLVICLAECEEMTRQTGWERLDGTPVEVWVRTDGR